MLEVIWEFDRFSMVNWSFINFFCGFVGIVFYRRYDIIVVFINVDWDIEINNRDEFRGVESWGY